MICVLINKRDDIVHVEWIMMWIGMDDMDTDARVDVSDSNIK